MILDKLTLYNFGAYRGEHSVVLSPVSKSRPIILFGGLNGAGKTTLLDALQLTFYGKLAKCASRGARAYDDFLASSINRHAQKGDGAFVELKFRHQHEAATKTYAVRRTWKTTPSAVKERVDVLVDGVPDTTMADAWPEYAEDFIPSRLAHLFFFDGEKIEALADLDNAAELLRAGVHSLLGLDVVDRLSGDLRVLAARKTKQAAVDPDTIRKFTQLEAEVVALEKEVTTLHDLRAAANTRLERTRHEVTRLELRLGAEGGDAFQQRHALTSTKENLEREIENLENELRELASDSLPLALVTDLLLQLSIEGEVHQSHRDRAMVGNLLLERDEDLLRYLKKAKVPQNTIALCNTFLESDRKARLQSPAAQAIPAIPLETSRQITQLLGEDLPRLRATGSQKLADLERLQGRLQEAERQIKSIPDEEAIAPILQMTITAKAQLIATEAEVVTLEENHRTTLAALERKRTERDRAIHNVAEAEMESMDAHRITEYAMKATGLLHQFRGRVVEKHLEHIQALILNALQTLLRKKRLVKGLSIDPKSFEVILQGADNAPLGPERLSAGERQLLAVSMLWGLAKASRRPLPAVIDTPLGRLDSSHRKSLVERYFPRASHQVLLLSTDEEIRGPYLSNLSPYVGRHYTISYDESEMSSRVHRGYFE